MEEFAQEAGIPIPRIYIIPDDSPNAFATGRNPEHAAVAVTEGILRILTPAELEGVLAHEMGHVRNRDILISTIAATLAGAIMILANMAKWAAIFGTGRDDDESRAGDPGMPSSPPLPPCSFRWPSPAPGSIWRTKPGPIWPTIPNPWPAPWRS